MPGTPVRRGATEEEERRLRLLAVADDVVVRLGRVGRRMPHDPSSSRWRRHLRLIGDSTHTPEAAAAWLRFRGRKHTPRRVVGLTDISLCKWATSWSLSGFLPFFSSRKSVWCIMHPTTKFGKIDSLRNRPFESSHFE